MRRVIVVGAGLAGLMVARVLSGRGFDVEIVEASGRAGGKAGADEIGGEWREHGYHIFPAWYANTRALLRDLGISLIDLDRWHYIRPGELDRPITVRMPESLGDLLEVFGHGLVPWPEMVLYWYFALDALAEPMDRKAFLDRISRVGLMRSRWYVTDRVALLEKENILKASAIPAYEMSAMTARLVSAYWAEEPKPLLSILPGDLQTHFIHPFENAVTAAGVPIHFGKRVEHVVEGGGEVAKVRCTDGTEFVGDYYVLTTPLEVARTIIKGDLLRVDPDLGKFEHLDAAPMAALHLTLNRRLYNLPREHVFLFGGRYGLSFIDLTPHWPGLTHTVLSFISSNFLPIQDLTETEQFDLLFEEIQQYLPISRADVATHKLNTNVDVPLFINTVGAWPHRPEVRAERVNNLFFAGDWVRNPIDLACMEGAISAAMECARQIGIDAGVMDIPAPKRPKTPPAWKLRLLKWALAPAVAAVWAYSHVDGQ